MSRDRIEALQEVLGYSFRDAGLLRTALTHKSFVNEHPGEGGGDNERLEFLGDAVLGLIVSRLLVERFPTHSEGELTKLRATVVSEASLAEVSRALGLGDGLRLGRGEEQTGGRSKPSILADAYEAVLAAIFLDGGLDAASAAVLRHLAKPLSALERDGAAVDHKSRLQEIVQAELRLVPRYRLVAATGPDHDKTFEMELTVGTEVLARGAGRTKKEAEQRAAEAALRQLEERRRRT